MLAPEAEEPIWKHYMVALDDFQRSVILAQDPQLRSLRITHAIVPTDTAPETYEGPYAGFPVVCGDAFQVRLSNGITVQG